jgi:copper oxidase (laccase) domain-containing protein
LKRALNADWITPDWPAPPWVHAVCTTRAGGVSKAPFDKLNLGDHVGDAPGDVAANRSNFARQIGAKPVFLNQVHGFEVAWLTSGAPHDARADACLTRQPGVACTIMVADCLPVLFANRLGTVVAAAHAGWRGLLGGPSPNGPVGVLERCFREFEVLGLKNIAQTAIKNVVNDTLVWLGPCIGPRQFEVGGEVRDAFLALTPDAVGLFQETHDAKWLADLPGLARQRLAALGIDQIYGNDGSDAWCTASNPLRFFSHRRDHVALGGSGRMAASIWLE